MYLEPRLLMRLKLEFRYPFTLTDDYYIKLLLETKGRSRLIQVINDSIYDVDPIVDVDTRMTISEEWSENGNNIRLGVRGNVLLLDASLRENVPILVICCLDLPSIATLLVEDLGDKYARGRLYFYDIFLRSQCLRNYSVKLPLQLVEEYLKNSENIITHRDGLRIYFLVRP